jgi:hypothetical protein
MHATFDTLLQQIVSAYRADAAPGGDSEESIRLLQSRLPASGEWGVRPHPSALIERLPLRSDIPPRAAAAARAGLRFAIEETQAALGDVPEEAQEWANNVVYALLSQGLLPCAADLGRFLMLPELSNGLRDIDAKVRAINCATAHHLMGEQGPADEVLNFVRWDDSLPDFQLAVAALRLDFGRAAELMHSIGRKGRLLRQSSYVNWPSLSAFRQSPEFARAYHHIFGSLNDQTYAVP